MPTIRDIAERAGVSISSVSRALNNYPDINADTRARILRIAEELHYWPSATAKNLATARTETVGVYFAPEDASGLRHPFISHVLTVFAHTVGAAGYDLLWFVNSRAPFDHWDLVDRVRHRAVDGLFLIGSPGPVLDDLLAADIPLVGLDFAAHGARVGTVTSDNRSGMRELVGMLAAAGYSRLAYLYGLLERPPAMERLQGFYAACEEREMPVRPEWVKFGGWSRETGCRGALELLAETERPEVILTASDDAAFGVLDALRAAGIRVPEEMAVAGFDDVAGAAHTVPPLTTVRQDKEGMGRTAGEVLVEMMSGVGAATKPHHYVLPTEVVRRGSVGAGPPKGPESVHAWAPTRQDRPDSP